MNSLPLLSKLILEQEQQLDAAMPQPGADSALPQGAPSASPQAPQPLTSEGKVFLIDLIKRALAISPDNISQQDKAVFNEKLTTENADTVLKKLQNIIEQF